MKEIEHIIAWLDSDLSALTKEGIIAALKRMMAEALADLQAPPGEWTKECRANFGEFFDNPDWAIQEKLDEACAIIDRLEANLQKLKGKRDHPEHYCHLCGGRNVTWHADNDLWNEVTGDGGLAWGTICCPLCFVAMAEKKGISCTSWRISREDDDPTVDKLRLEIDRLEAENQQDHDRLHDLGAEVLELKNNISLAIDGIDALNLITDRVPTCEDFEAIKQTLGSW